jgi:hypothetical protein
MKHIIRTSKDLILVVALAMLALSVSASAMAMALAPRAMPQQCSTIDSYYWEIGDKDRVLASGSVVGPSKGVYTRTTKMEIASASKWLYGAYVVQTKALTEADKRFLNFTSGYIDFSICTSWQTVARCSAAGSNDTYTPSAVGMFSYGGAHMQRHAALSPLGPMDKDALGAEMSKVLGAPITYSQPQLAGGAFMSAGDYAQFLQAVLKGSLKISGSLGADAVCTNPKTCPTALNAPTPQSESWHYSIGHWVEDDPSVGDGAFSSAGAFGFYPWISADKRFYGIVARKANLGGGEASAKCGREIRRSWISTH